MAQTAEQETARQLISEASQKLSEAVQRKANNLQGAKVAQAMLSVGNEKLTACTKQLGDIKHEKEKIEQKLKSLSRELLIRRALLTVLNLLHQILLPKKTKTSLKLKH